MSRGMKIGHAIQSLALLVCLAALCFGTFAGASVDFRGDWETGSWDQWDGVEYGGAFDGSPRLSDVLQVVTNPVAQGRYAGKFIVNPGDKYGGSTGERTLARWVGSSETPGEDFYYAWSTLLPTDWVTPSSWAIPLEWHSDSRFPLAPIRFNISGEKTYVAMSTGNCSDPFKCEHHQNHLALSTLSRGKWQDFILRIRWHTSGGVLQLWHRVQGQASFNRVVDLNNVPTLPYRPGDSRPATIYVLQGLYRGDGTGYRSVIYHDGFRRGTSYAEVAADFTQVARLDPPTVAPAPSSPTTPSVSGPTAGSFVVEQNVAEGQVLSGSARWTAAVTGKIVRSVEFVIDGRLSWTERYSPYTYNGDGNTLDTRKLADGRHTLEVRAHAADGSSTKTSATVSVANGSSSSGTTPIGTPTPALASSLSDGQTISGLVSWTVAPGGQAFSRMEFFIDSAHRWTERHAPWVYNGDGNTLDTTTLADGSHVLEVKAYAPDGSVVSATATVTISNGTSSTTASATATSGSTDTTAGTSGDTSSQGSSPGPAPDPAPEPSTPSAPALVSSISDGASLEGLVRWTVDPEGFTVSKMEFFVDSKLMWTERHAPWVYNGDGQQLDTRTLGRGTHTLEIRATGTDGVTRTLTLAVRVE
jgi:hypothetical protein